MRTLKHVQKIFLTWLMMLAILAMTACGSDTVETSEGENASEVVEEDGGQEKDTDAETKEDITKEHVELTMYLLGDRTPDFDMVFEKINEKMREKINATLNVKFMSWSEYEQKYPLVFASGEDWDIIYSANWAFYNSQATKQGFWEITQSDLEKYAPMTAETMYAEAWEQAKVNDKVYMLPMNYKEITSYVYIARGDLMDKYGLNSVSTIDEVEAYCEAIAENEPTFIPLDIGSDYDALFMYDRMWGEATAGVFENVGPWQLMASVDPNAEDFRIIGNVYQDAFRDVAVRLKEWKDKGFWSKSAAVNTQNNKESFAAGKSALALMNVNTAKSEYGNLVTSHPEWNVRVFDAQGRAPSVLQSYLANGMSIFSKSKNPERALMAIDLLRNDEEINNLFCYGIEGVHWEASGEDKLVSLEAASNYPYDGNCNWGVRNDKYWRTLEGGIPGLAEMTKHWKETAESGSYANFNFNDEAVKNEVAALNDIFSTDYKLLCLGFTDDPEKDIEKIQKKMEAAGADRVYEEMTKQVLEYMEQ